MKKIKTLGLAVLAVVALGAFAHAAKSPNNVDTVLNKLGQEAHPLNAGYLHVRDSATGEMIVCSGKCLLAAIIMGTGPTTSTVKIRNSSVADGTGALVIWPRFEVANSGYGQAPFPPLPILLDKGITVELPAASSGEQVTVLYRDMD